MSTESARAIAQIFCAQFRRTNTTFRFAVCLLMRVQMQNPEMVAKNRITGLIMLHHLLDKIPLLGQAVASCESQILKTARDNFTLTSLDELKILLSSILNPEVSNCQRLFPNYLLCRYRLSMLEESKDF